MEDRPSHIQIVGSSADDNAVMTACLAQRGYGVHLAADAAAGQRSLAKREPEMVIIDLASDGARELAERLAAAPDRRPMMLLCGREEMEPTMKAFQGRADEFVGRPVRPVAFEIAFDRMCTLSAFQRRLHARPPGPAGGDAGAADAGVADERFRFIKQIARNLSAFMGQIASDAQDGLRYFDEMPYFMAIHSSDGRVLAANPTYQTLLGNRVGLSSNGIYTDADTAPETAPVAITLKTGKITATRKEVRYLSGSCVPVIVHTAPIFDALGRIELVLEVFAGAKEIETMARDIRTTQQRYRQLFDAVPNYVAVLDRQMRLTAFNRRFLEDFGFKTGRKFYEIFKPVSSSPEKGPIARTLDDALPHQGELSLFSPGGDQLYLMAWTSPIKSAAGKLLQVLVIFTDVTELRRLQDNLTQLGLMISTVTHSLKGSLTGLDAGIYMIDKGFYRNRPGRIEEGLEVAKLMTDRIRKIVRDILYYAKERELELESVDANRFAADIASTLQTKITAANIKLRFQLDADAGKLEIDPGLVRASLINILENAIEACIEDETDRAHWIELRVKGEPEHVIYTVADNGVGMKSDQMQNIFKQFWSSKGKKGTGLGLFITNTVIRRHGGKIAVESEPGHFTAFHLRLPRTQARSGNTAAHRHAGVADSAS